MKKIHIRTLSLLLVLVMLCSGIGMQAFADYYFADQSLIGSPYRDAVNYMLDKEIFEGFPDGHFHPKDSLTREQGAKIVASLVLGSSNAQFLNAEAAPFTDVPRNRWSAGYIEYCANAGILSGYGNGTFGPNNSLTGLQFCKMLLCAYEYGTADDYTGSDWESKVSAAAKSILLFNGDPTIATTQAITRQQAALCAYNAVTAGNSGRSNDLSGKISIDACSLSLYRTLGNAPVKTQRFFRNLDEEMTFELALDHSRSKANGYMNLMLRVSDYNSQTPIADYPITVPVSADKLSDKASITVPMDKILAYDASHLTDYFATTLKYKVDVVYQGEAFKTFTFTVSFNSQAAETFARAAKSTVKFWAATAANEIAPADDSVFNTRFVGMVRTLGADIRVKTGDQPYYGTLPLVCKWFYDGNPIYEQTVYVDFPADDLEIYASISNENYEAYNSGTYECYIYIFNNLIASGDCRITK